MSQQRWVWSMQHGGIATVTTTTLWVYGLGALADATGWPWQHAATATAITTLSALTAGWLQHLTRPVLAYLTVVTLTAGGWVTYAAATTAISSTAASILLTAAIPLAALYPAARNSIRRQRGHPDHHDHLPEPRRSADPAMQAALNRVAGRGIHVLQRHDLQHGHLYVLEPPDTGRITPATLRQQLDALHVAADLPDGTLLEVLKGDRGRRIHLRVTQPGALERDILLPDEHDELDINQPIDVGVTADITPYGILLREVNALASGQTGGGKTMLAHTVIAQGARCPNLVIWFADLSAKKAKAARRWNKPYHDGEPDMAPVIDWVATTPAEFQHMLTAAKRLIAYRAETFGDAEKVIPTNDVPQLLIIVEEGGAALAPTQIKADRERRERGEPTSYDLVAELVQIATTGREQAVGALVLTPRPTISMTGSSDLTSAIGLRIGTKGTDLHQLLPGHQVRPDALTAPGMLYIQHRPGEPPQFVKGYKVPWERIPELARLCNQYLVGLEDGAEQALGEDYIRRWDRYHTLFPKPGWPAHATSPTTTATATATAGTTPDPGQRPEWMDRPGGLLEVVPPTPPWRRHKHTDPADGGQVDRAFAELVADIPRVPPILAAVDTVFADHHHPDRLHTAVILKAIGDPALNDKRLGLLLTPLGVQSTNPWEAGGRRGRGYLRADVHAALEAIRAGELRPPASVYDWTPQQP